MEKSKTKGIAGRREAGGDVEFVVSAYQTAEERGAILSAIVQCSDDAIISKDLSGIITSWNGAAERIFGYLSSEIIGRSIMLLIPDELADEEPAILSKIRAGERVENFDTKRKRKDGQLIDVSLTISPVISSQGNIIGISKIARDITQWKVAQSHSAMLSAIIESSYDAIISKDLNSIITSWNLAAERIFGYSSSEMIGSSILKLIPMDRQQEETLFLNRIGLGERIEHFETQRITKNGNLIDVSLTLSPVRDGNGKIIGVSKIARDITARKFEEMRRNDFIAFVSHELKTPLTTLRSYIQLALSKSRNQGDRFIIQVLGRAELQAKKMTNMIHSFLEFSRAKENKMALNLSRFSLLEFMEEIISEALILAPDHLIRYESCKEATVWADRDKIGHVLLNLLSNAAKYSDPGSQIEVKCIVGSHDIEFSVADQGIGISLADQKYLFERFYRSNEVNSQKVNGFGIGLYLVSEILKLHGSRIEIASSPGKGSLFSFFLSCDDKAGV